MQHEAQCGPNNLQKKSPFILHHVHRKTYRIYWTLVPPDPHLTHPIQHPNNTQRRLCTPSSRRPVCRDKGSMQGYVCERDEVDRHECLRL